MIFATLSEFIVCPYCSENIEIVIDGSIDNQEYTEDCAVCCQPIVINVDVNDDDVIKLTARSEQEC